MKRVLRPLLCTSLCLLLVSQQSEAWAQAETGIAAPPAAKPAPVKLAKGTLIQFVTLESVSSASAQNGQVVRLEIKNDVQTHGVVVIPKGTPAVGIVKHVSRAVPDKKDGYVRIVPVNVKLPNGAQLKMGENLPGEDDCASVGPCWVLYALFAPIALGVVIRQRRENRRRTVEGKNMVLPAFDRVLGYTQKTIRLVPAVKELPLPTCGTR